LNSEPKDRDEENVLDFLNRIDVLRPDDLRKRRYRSAPIPVERPSFSDRNQWLSSNIQLAWMCYGFSGLAIIYLAFFSYSYFLDVLVETGFIDHFRIFSSFLCFLFLVGLLIACFVLRAASEISEMKNLMLNWQIGVGSSVWLGLYAIGVIFKWAKGNGWSFEHIIILFAFACQIIGFMSLGSIRQYYRDIIKDLETRML